MKKILSPLLLTYLGLAAASPAFADVGYVTPGNKIADELKGVTEFDVAFDEVNRVYLVTWGSMGFPTMRAIFLNDQGLPISALFEVAPPGFGAGWTRVVWSPHGGGMFMVTYLRYQLTGTANSPKVYAARFVKFNASAPSKVDYVTGEIVIEPDYGFGQSRGGTVYLPVNDTFLATYTKDVGGLPHSWVAMLRPSGVIGKAVMTDASDGMSDPALDCDPQSGRCLMGGYAWGAPFYPAAPGGKTWLRLFDGTTLAPVSQIFYADTGPYNFLGQNVAYAPASRQFVVLSAQNGGLPVTRTVSLTGQLSPNSVIARAPTDGCGGGYGQLNWSLEYVRTTSTLVFGAKDWCGGGWVQELDSAANPTAGFLQVSAFDPALQTLSPAIAVNAVDPNNTQFLFGAVHPNTNYTALFGRVMRSFTGVVSPPPAPPPTARNGEPVGEIPYSVTAAPNGSWYFAEGAVGLNVDFDTYYLIENPHDEAVDVSMYLSDDRGSTWAWDFTIGAHTRLTKRLKELRDWSGNATAVIQARTAGRDVRVERSMYWKGFGGGHLATGTKDVDTRWYFAEGSRVGELFKTYYMIFNPANTVTATATLDFYRRDGVLAKQETLTIPPRGRRTVLANWFAELAGTDFSVIITSNSPVVAERSMYWQDFGSGHSSEGVTSLSNTWYFAEGAVFLRFWTYYLILNPNPTPVSVAVDYIGEGRLIDSDVYVVNPTTRTTLLLNDELRRLGHGYYEGGVAAKFRTLGGEPIIVERSTYWGRPWQEGANSIGLRQPAPTWFVPEGTTAGGFDSYQFVMNPNAHPITVRLRVITQNSARALGDIVLTGLGRKTYYMNDELARLGLAPQPFSLVVECLGGDCVAEHAVYWDRLVDGNLWGGGSTAVAIPGPAQ